MTEQSVAAPVKIGFETRTLLIRIADIKPSRSCSVDFSKSVKYKQICPSLKSLGSIEPPIVVEDRLDRGKYLLLDGHVRIKAMRELGETQVACLVSTDDEAFTYNKRVNRLATVQQHRMITRAIERGVSEERIAEVLNISPFTVNQSKRLLDGICSEVAEILKDKFVAKNAFWILRRMKPARQIEAAELMVAMNRFTLGYARALLAATPPDQIEMRGRRIRKVKGLQISNWGLWKERLPAWNENCASLRSHTALITWIWCWRRVISASYFGMHKLFDTWHSAMGIYLRSSSELWKGMPLRRSPTNEKAPPDDGASGHRPSS